MLKVIGYTQKDEAKVLAFMRKIVKKVQPDRDVASRSILIKNDENVVGMVSYEPHSDLGIVRYFLYDACVAGTDVVVGMFFELYKQAHAQGVKKLVARVPKGEACHLFELLGFVKASHTEAIVTHSGEADVEILVIQLDETSPIASKKQ